MKGRSTRVAGAGEDRLDHSAQWSIVQRGAGGVGAAAPGEESGGQEEGGGQEESGGQEEGGGQVQRARRPL